MNNKVLVKVITPHFNGEYDVFIPTNEYVYVVTKLIVKVLKDINEAGSDSKTVFQLMNVDTGIIRVALKEAYTTTDETIAAIEK